MHKPREFVSRRARALPSTRLARPMQALAAACLFGLALVAVSLAAMQIQAAPPAHASPQVQDLIAKAQAKGSVRLIVGLDTAFQAEGTLAGPSSAINQRGRIRAAQDAVLREMAGTNTALMAKFKYIPYMALEVDAGALLHLAALPETTSFQEDVPEPAALASSIPVIGADAAWLAGYTGSGQAVAVLDTGVDKAHPFFATGGSKVVSEACYSTNSAPFMSNSVCPGGVSESVAVGSGVDCVVAATGYTTAQHQCKHGTHVAGIAAGDDGGTDIGVARDADVIAIQVFSLFTDTARCGSPGGCALTWRSDQIKGLERVYELRNDFDIAAANMSLGGAIKYPSPCDVPEAARKAAIDNLLSAGIATVIASGNNSWLDGVAAPGCISTGVTVGATDDSDNVPGFSNIASFLDLLAPGVDIVSAVPGGLTESKNGTSMATPHVAGAWAVIKGKAPSASVAEVLAALRDTGTSVDDGRLGGSVTDMRRINLDQALAQFQAALAITKTVELTNDPARPGDPVTYTVVLANLSDVTAAGVKLTDTLPAYVVGADLDATLTITAGERVTHTLPATVAEDVPHGVTITNTAYYSHTDAHDESSAAFDVGTVRTSLAITKTAEPAREPTLRGGPITYTIVVANSGSVDAAGVRITDTLPMYIEGDDLDTTATVTAGERVTYTLYVTVALDAPFDTPITNTAYYSHTGARDASSAGLTVVPQIPRLAILKTVELGPEPVGGGDPVTYTVVVSNSGGSSATGVHITDTLPMYVVGPGLDTTATITAGYSVTYTLNVTMAAEIPFGITITNTAYYSHTSGRDQSSAAFGIPWWLTYLPSIQK